MTSANTLSATAALAALRAGTLSARQLVEACLSRIESRDKDVAAWTYINPEQVRRMADQADQAKAAGKPLGPLHGLPVGIKDIIDTADMPTANGSALFAGRRPVADSTIARLLRDAGAIIMGKTVTTEFALNAAGKTRNPHNPLHTPGGSSSGSAASVADDQVPLAIGTQTGGSMIRPASYCGIHGFKPSFGSISRAGMFSLARPLDQPGIYARSLEDIALCGDVLMTRDRADLDMRGHIKPQLLEALATPSAAPPRIAFIKGPMWAFAEPYMDGLFSGVMATLGGHASEVEMAGIFDDALDCHAIVMMANVVANIGDHCRNHADKVRPETIERVRDSYSLLAEDYVKAIEFRDTIKAAVERIFDNYDVIMTPAAPGEAPRDLSNTGNAVFQKLWTLCGVPTVTLPKLQGPTGLPIGVQLIGRYAHDGDLLRHARWIESSL